MRLSFRGGKLNTAMLESKYFTGNTANFGKNAARPTAFTIESTAAPTPADPALKHLLSKGSRKILQYYSCMSSTSMYQATRGLLKIEELYRI